MKKLIGFLVLLIGFALSMSSCSERIDAGYEGIKVNLYGSDKGVDEISLVSGRIWFNPFFTTVYEFPTFVQTYDYEPFTVNAKDGSVFTVDPTLSVAIISGSTPKIFKKYRKDIDQIMSVTFGNHIKDVYRIEFNRYTTDEIISSREKFEAGIEKKMNVFFTKEGFNLEQLTSGIRYPKSITEAIDLKNKSVQDAQRVEHELRVVEAEAKKSIVQAEAKAQAKLIDAESRAKANKTLTQSLSPLLIEYEYAIKWDGKLPTTTSNNLSVMKGLTK